MGEVIFEIILLTVLDTIQSACGTPFPPKKLNFNMFQVMQNGFVLTAHF